ncbi:hypothetical protein [Desulfosporosinus sp. BG]|uniref:hypothetical protein n=1 Tax=Desulfosporosinus sp. BG TaxID=1633135 RepID=UPI000857C10D|nr:hypothetical protein [Desulfosporosinus sp. BG]ODA41625.1 hypothetical protein DSBG_1554 [Desulfosporosinus sp. BG]
MQPRIAANADWECFNWLPDVIIIAVMMICPVGKGPFGYHRYIRHNDYKYDI